MPDQDTTTTGVPESNPGDSVTPSRITRDRVASYIVSPVIAALAVLVYFQPWRFGADSAFNIGSDAIWQQAIFQVHAQAGVFGTTEHLAYPLGMSGWQLPQMGMLVGLFAWISGANGIPTAAAVLVFMALAAGINTAGVMYLLRAVTGPRLLGFRCVAAVTLGASVWTVDHQINLGLFVVVPIAIGLLLRWENGIGRRWPALTAVLVWSVISGLWWVVVLFLLLPFVALPGLLRRQWREVRAVAACWAAVLAGIAVQGAIFLTRLGPGSDQTRQPWFSNYSYGHMVDLVIGSPLVRMVLPRRDALIEGGTVEASWGFTIVAAAAVALVVLLAVPSRRSREIGTSLLAGITISATLFWLGGGLANVQDAIAVLAGGTSPARVFYRMLLVIALAGLVWAEVILLTSTFSKRTIARISGTAAVLLALIWVGDLLAIRQRLIPPMPVTESAAVAEIRRSLPPCPIAQFPNEAIPGERVAVPGIGYHPDRYRGYVPYVLAPEYYWTAGSYAPGQADVPGLLSKTPQVLTAAATKELGDQGYCAVLFDKRLAARAQAQGVAIEGRSLSPDMPDPSWNDDRYALYPIE